MNTSAHLIVVLLSTALLSSACSTMRAQSGHDPAYDFSRLKTWEWAPDAGTAKTEAAAMTSERIRLHQLVRERVRDELIRKGYVLHIGGGEFLVGWSFGEWKLERRTSPGGGYGAVGLMYPGAHASPPRVSKDGRALPPSVDPYSSSYEKATIELMIIDPKSHRIIWNASVTDDSDFGYYTSAQRNRISEAIETALRDFPPPVMGH